MDTKVNQTVHQQSNYAALENVARLFGLVSKLQSRSGGLPGIGVFHGPSGYGKTISTIFAQNRTRALLLQIGDSWTRKKLLEKLLEELGETGRKGSIANMAEWAIECLAEDPDRPLIIDEADKLVDKGMIELLRELYEHAQVPVLLIGEELLPEKLMKHERVHNRVLSWVAAQPCNASDARKLADIYCRGIRLSDDLIDLIVEKSGGVARRICVNLDQIREEALLSSQEVYDTQYFAPGFFYTGEPRSRGRRAA
ncbi:AAA family ATPase [Roseibium litorale]|uniref:AAA family ATPase n=1 Tax=Roseibium litorale TaxID=2803841 RepID=UPI001AD8DEBA|nr:AAA family ATPase [Roseibium litorale]